jgi:hypothetical protein
MDHLADAFGLMASITPTTTTTTTPGRSRSLSFTLVGANRLDAYVVGLLQNMPDGMEVHLEPDHVEPDVIAVFMDERDDVYINVGFVPIEYAVYIHRLLPDVKCVATRNLSDFFSPKITLSFQSST